MAQWPDRYGRSELTPREQQVLELVEQGMKNKEIGRELGHEGTSHRFGVVVVLALPALVFERGSRQRSRSGAGRQLT